jgi:hypothetical protein
MRYNHETKKIKFFRYKNNEKYKPTKWLYIYRYKKLLRELRNVGKEQINKRIQLLKEGAYVPNDLLNSFLKAHGSCSN